MKQNKIKRTLNHTRRAATKSPSRSPYNSTEPGIYSHAYNRYRHQAYTLADLMGLPSSSSQFHIAPYKRVRKRIHDRVPLVEMRDRSRLTYTTDGSGSFVLYASDDSTIILNVPQPVLSLKDERIIDVVGRRESFNPLVHCVSNDNPVSVRVPANGGLFTDDGAGGYFVSNPSGIAMEYLRSDKGGTIEPRGNPRFPQGYLDYVANLDSVHQLAWSRMFPTVFHCGTNIVDFLIELPQLKFLYKDWVEDSHNWSLLMRAVGLMDGKESLRVLSNANLSYQFGLAPFITDVSNLYTLFRDMRSSLDEFVHRANTINKAHTVDPIQSFSDKYSFLYPNDTAGKQFGDGAIVTVNRTISTCYRATSVFRYTIPDLQQTWNVIRMYMSYIGLDIDASDIWNEIPFSFVVDWFVNIAAFLHSHRYQLFSVNVSLIDFGYSLESTYITSGFITGSNGIDYPIGQNVAKIYSRDKAVPLAASDVPMGRFHLNQFLLGLSLGGQRLH